MLFESNRGNFKKSQLIHLSAIYNPIKSAKHPDSMVPDISAF